MTPTGRGLLSTSIAIYLIGWGLGYPELNFLGATGLLLIVAAMVTVARPVRLDAEHRLAPQRVKVGETAESILTVTNSGTRRSPAVLGTEAISTTAPRPGAEPPPGGIDVAIGRLRPQRAQTLHLRLPTQRRAVFDVGPFVVTRSDPFGMFRRRSHHGSATRFWVHPRIHTLGPIPQGHQRDLEGPTTESARGEAVFHSLREYVVGDDLRRIHWKATAHQGTLMVREHADPVRPDATIVLDDREGPSLQDDGFDLAVEAVASISVAARRSGFPVRLVSVSGRLRTPPVADDTALLDLLAGATRHPHDELAGVTQQLLAGPGGRALIVVTGLPTAEELARWATAGRRYGTVIVIAVLEPPGADPTSELAALPSAPAGITLLPARSAEELVAGWGGLR